MYEELMHEWLKKDAVLFDLSTEEIIQQLADENKELCDKIKKLNEKIQYLKKESNNETKTRYSYSRNS